MQRKYYDDLGNLIIRPYKLKDLAAIYQTKVRTLRRWIKTFEEELGEKPGHHYSVHQVHLIVQKIGVPHRISTQLKLEAT